MLAWRHEMLGLVCLLLFGGGNILSHRVAIFVLPGLGSQQVSLPLSTSILLLLHIPLFPECIIVLIGVWQ